MTPAVSTAAFDGHPMEAALNALAALGVAAVEPAYIRGYTEFDEGTFTERGGTALAAMLVARGLRPQAVSAHMDLSGPEAEAMLARRIRFVQALGARILVTNAGPATGRAAILAAIGGALPALEQAGLTLALENPGHGSGDLIGRGEEGAALIAEIDAALVRLNLDLGNLVTYAGGLEPNLSAALPWAAHAHLKDVAEDGPDWRFVALGDGCVDWARVRAALPPGLPVALELPLRLSRPGRGDPVRAGEPLPLPVIMGAIRRSLDAWARI